MSSEKKESIIAEMQEIEHSMQSLLIQRQNLEIESEEIKTAISELEKTEDEVYKIVGSVLIKSEKNSLISELKDKKKINELKLESVEKQESALQQKISSLRKDISK